MLIVLKKIYFFFQKVRKQAFPAKHTLEVNSIGVNYAKLSCIYVAHFKLNTLEAKRDIVTLHDYE